MRSPIAAVALKPQIHQASGKHRAVFVYPAEQVQLSEVCLTMSGLFVKLPGRAMPRKALTSWCWNARAPISMHTHPTTVHRKWDMACRDQTEVMATVMMSWNREQGPCHSHSADLGSNNWAPHQGKRDSPTAESQSKAANGANDNKP